MADPNGLSCCGMTELADIRHDTVEQALMSIEPDDQGIIIFSDVREYNKGFSKGHALAKTIKAKKLGMIIALPPTRNPNTGHTIKAWMWKVNIKALGRWQEKIRKAKPADYPKYDPYAPWRPMPW